MSWPERCCRLGRPATVLLRPRSRPSFISSTITRQAFATSEKPSTSDSSLVRPPKLNFDGTTSNEPGKKNENKGGSLADTSIFAFEAKASSDESKKSEDSQKAPWASEDGTPAENGPLEGRDPETMAAVLDPDPEYRRRFERRMVIQEIRKRGRLTKEQLLKRTERVYVSQSEFEKTGMKKVAPLARQIAGKTIDDAIIQMQFSKKKAATWILDHLKAARRRAIIERGMGLGKKEAKPIKIELKDGTRHKVTDTSQIYIDQAWVNKGPYGKAYNKRAKKRIDVLKLPQTAITVQLKEEKTRIRESTERLEKGDRKKVWMQLPNRPITAQRPYYSW